MYWGEASLALVVFTVIVSRLSPSMVARDCSVLLVCWTAFISQTYEPGVAETNARVGGAAIAAWIVAGPIANAYVSRLPTIIASGFFLMVMWSMYSSFAGVPAYNFKYGHNLIFDTQCAATLGTVCWQWWWFRRRLA